MVKVLIPDPMDFAQTAALRGLGRRGDVCDVFWPHLRRMEKFQSRYCHRAIPAPVTAEDDPDAFAKAAIELAKEGGYDVLLPTRGSSVEALVPRLTELDHQVATLMPSAEQFQLGIDKQTTIAFCKANGVVHPETTFIASERDEIESVARSFGFPVVIKHPRNFGASIGVRMVRDQATLQQAIAALTNLPGPSVELMVQQFLPGAIYDACLVAKDGRIEGLVTQERRLMYPISGGVACVLATVEIPELTALTRTLVEGLKWNGPAQIEFKWDPDKRAFSLIEINPRFWATTGAWLRAGANFPALTVDLALGRKPLPFPTLPANLRFRYIVGRTPFALTQLWRAKGWQAIRDPKRYTRTWYDFDLTDPLPDLYRLFWEARAVLGGRRNLADETLPADCIPSYETGTLKGKPAPSALGMAEGA